MSTEQDFIATMSSLDIGTVLPCSCSSDSATNESACTGGADPWAGVGTLGTDALDAGDPAGESVLNASAVSTAVSAVVEVVVVVVVVVLVVILLLLLLLMLLLLLLLLSQPNLLLSASLLADLLDLVFLTTSVLDLLLLLFEFGYLGMISVTL